MPNKMKDAIAKNIVASVIEKGGVIVMQFFASILLIRLLASDLYGIIGIVAGVYAFIQLLNISLEQIIMRDHLQYKERTISILYNFILFNLMKVIIFLALAWPLSSYLSTYYHHDDFFFAVYSISILLATDAFIAPLTVYACSQFKQALVTKLSLLRSGLNLVLLLGLFYSPTLKFLLIKDIAVSFVTILLWAYASKRHLNLNWKDINIRKDFQFSFIKKSFTGYSIWVHLIGVSTNLIYRSDAFFLSLFAPLGVVGNYNIALNSANIANILPSVLGQQNSVAISHTQTQEEAHHLTGIFIRLSLYLGIFTLLCFIFLGLPYLHVITGKKDIQDIYLYQLCIVTGLVIVKTIASPLVGYINIKGNVRQLFCRVHLPTLLLTVILYYTAASYYKALGCAISNILIACFWCCLVLIEMKRYHYKISSIRFADFISDWKRLCTYIKEIRNEHHRTLA